MLDALDTSERQPAAANKDPLIVLLRSVYTRRTKRGLCQKDTINSPTNTLHSIEVIILETHGRDNLRLRQPEQINFNVC